MDDAPPYSKICLMADGQGLPRPSERKTMMEGWERKWFSHSSASCARRGEYAPRLKAPECEGVRGGMGNG